MTVPAMRCPECGQTYPKGAACCIGHALVVNIAEGRVIDRLCLAHADVRELDEDENKLIVELLHLFNQGEHYTFERFRQSRVEQLGAALSALGKLRQDAERFLPTVYRGLSDVDAAYLNSLARTYLLAENGSREEAALYTMFHVACDEFGIRPPDREAIIDNLPSRISRAETASNR